jgi:NitT/TauT family transport system substrate-binding protein
MPFYIARDEGYFAEQNLDVEFRQIGRNQDIMAAVASGDVDVVTGMLTVNELGLVASGARLRLVASLGESPPEACPLVAVMTRRDTAESGALTDPAAIRKLRFDFDSILPLGYFVDVLLRPYHLTTHDLDVVNIPPPAALEALHNGDIDVTVEGEPYITMQLDRGAVIWDSLEHLLPGYVSAALMFGPDLLDQRPDVGRRLMVAVLEGIRRFRAGKTPRNLDIVAQASGLPRDQLERTCWPWVSENARIDPATLRAYQQWSVDEGLVDHVIPDDELFDDRFIEYANAELAK